MASTVAAVKADTNSPKFNNFTVYIGVNNNYDRPTFWNLGYGGEVINPSDSVVDGIIPGLNDNGKTFDIVTVIGGAEYSIANGKYTYTIISDGVRDSLRFGYMSPEYSSPSGVPIGNAVTNLLVNGQIIDTAATNWPYLSNGIAILPPGAKCPQLTYPTAGQTILDANPRMTWLNPPGKYQADSVSFNVGVWFLIDNDFYLWAFEGLINPALGTLSVTFPTAPEYPGHPIREVVPSGKTLPNQLPTGTINYQLVAYEWFTMANPVSFLYTAYSTADQFTMGGKTTVNVTPESLNLKSNGEWITGNIELPTGYNPAAIDPSSIRINGLIPIDTSFTPRITDSNANGIPELTVKFDRSAVINLVSNVADFSTDTGKFQNSQLTISGIAAGTPFAGTCNVKIISK